MTPDGASRDAMLALQTQRLAGRWRMPNDMSRITKRRSITRRASSDFQDCPTSAISFHGQTDLRDNFPSTCAAVPRENWSALGFFRDHRKPIVVGYTEAISTVGERDGVARSAAAGAAAA